MGIVDLDGQPEEIREQAAILLVDHFSEPSGWPTLGDARDEVAHVLGAGGEPLQ